MGKEKQTNYRQKNKQEQRLEAGNKKTRTVPINPQSNTVTGENSLSITSASPSTGNIAIRIARHARMKHLTSKLSDPDAVYRDSLQRFGLGAIIVSNPLEPLINFCGVIIPCVTLSVR